MNWVGFIQLVLCSVVIGAIGANRIKKLSDKTVNILTYAFLAVLVLGIVTGLFLAGGHS